MRHALLALALGCGGGDGAPCDGVAGACVAMRVSSDTTTAVHQLELDVLYGETHSTTTIFAAEGGTIDLPFDAGIRFAITAETHIGIVGAGKLAGDVLGTGAASFVLQPDEHTPIDLVLAPPAECVPGGFYCGGDKLAGDPQTLYQCNGGGVPLARARCRHGCLVRPTADDVCDGGPMRCVEGGFYCGGNEVDGDPHTLYRCTNGEGTAPMRCANGCIVAPAGTDDRCR